MPQTLTEEKILLVGDSIARGVTYDENRSRHVILKDSVAGLVERGCTFAIENIAKFGATIDTAAKALYRRLAKIEEPPRAVVIEVGGNDSDFDWEAIAKDPQANHQPKTKLEDFCATLTEMISSVREKHIRPILCNLPPIDAERYFAYFTGGDAEKGNRILQWLGSIGKIYWWHERYNAAVEYVGEITNTPVINLRRALLQKEDYRLYIAKDGMHPNEEGQRLLAREAIAYVGRHHKDLMPRYV